MHFRFLKRGNFETCESLLSLILFVVEKFVFGMRTRNLEFEIDLGMMITGRGALPVGKAREF